MALAPVPQIPVFLTGSDPQDAQFAAWIQAPLSFWTTRVMFRAQLQGAQSFTAGTFTVLGFGGTGGDILEDPWGGFSNAGTASQGQHSWLCPMGCTGWYEITVTAFTADPGSNTDIIGTGIYLDGSLWSQPSASWGVNGHATGSCGSAVVWLAGGEDYVQGAVYTTGAVGAPGIAGQYATMEIVWISA